MIIKLHKNLGHPSNDRLARALQVNGSRPEVVQAAMEIRCAVCAAHAPPKHARPASLKTMLDFNHKIYLDGINWTSKQGKSYHLFHMLDAGTNYHVAIASPAKTSQDLIQVLIIEPTLDQLGGTSNRDGGRFRNRNEQSRVC